MPFISGPSGGMGIEVNQDGTDIKEFDAVTASGTIKSGTPITITNLCELGESKLLSGFSGLSGSVINNVRVVDTNRIVICNKDSHVLHLVDNENGTLIRRSSVSLPSNLSISNIIVLSPSSVLINAVTSSVGNYIAVAISGNTMKIGSTYQFTITNPVEYNSDMVRLDDTHALINAITYLSTDSWQYRQAYCILTINGTSISKGSLLTVEHDTRNKASMIRTKNYIYTIFDEDSSGSSQISSCIKYSNGIELCGPATYNCHTYDIEHVSGDTIYIFNTNPDSSAYDVLGYQITCSDAGLNGNFSYPYTIPSPNNNDWEWPNCESMIDHTEPLGIMINNHTLVNINISNSSDNINYVIYKDDTYCFSAVNPTYWKSLVLYRQFRSKTGGNALYNYSRMLNIGNNNVLCTTYGTDSSGNINYRIVKIRPTVCRASYIADGIASSDITTTSGKCYIF